jgi:hypothetical protein
LAQGLGSAIELRNALEFVRGGIRDVSGQSTSAVNLRPQSTSAIERLMRWCGGLSALAHFSILKQPADFGECRPAQPVDLGGCRPAQPVDLGRFRPVEPVDWVGAGLQSL